MIVNALAAATAIVEKLTLDVPSLAKAIASPDLDTAREGQLPSPCAHVIYDGYVVGGTESTRSGKGATQIIVQRWLVVIAVKNARDQLRNKAAIDTAGQVFPEVFAALAGWQPLPQMRALRLATAPRPLYEPACAYIPLAFEAELILGG